MILILSSSGDVSVDYVITWLKYYNYEYIRVNADEIFDGGFYYSLEKNEFSIKGKTIKIDEINAVWLRKFGNFYRTEYFTEIKNNVTNEDILQLHKEYNSILSVVALRLKNKKWITPSWRSTVNKSDILSLAKECEINIPKSWLISSKKVLKEIMRDYRVITKSVYEPYFIRAKNGSYSMFTKPIDESDAEDFPDTFFPSLIQEYIPKQYEIRTFYIEGRFYSMAIFSQSNKLTENDFRQYDCKNPTRRVPYKLPEQIETNLHKMLVKSDLNCCSVDLIKSSKDNLYYFLEVNPTGQFGMTSVPCNYEIHKDIAQTLIKTDTNEIR